jgi:peroxiredoxin Q/BCP
MFSWLFSDPLPVGSPAPEFSLPDDAGRIVKLSALRGGSVALVFYPGDDTPGCTKQLCEFRDSWDAVRARGIEVFGVNPQNAGSHARLRSKFKLPFPLLVDKRRHVAALYNAGGLIVKRTVYLIGPDGIIRLARRGMPKPEELILAADEHG